MRPTIEEIKEGFKKCGLKPVQRRYMGGGKCCGLWAFGMYLDLPQPIGQVERLLGHWFSNGFMNGWDGYECGDCVVPEYREGYELGRQAWESCQ